MGPLGTLLLRRRRCAAFGARATATATPPSPLAFGPGLLLLLLRRLLGTLGTLLRPGRVLRTRTVVALAIPFSASLRLLRARIRPRRTSTARATLVLTLASGSLLELLHFTLHELPRLRFLAVASGVVAAVRAALPTFRIGLLAGGAEDTFRERHR